jgi:hypothetical protein
MLILTGEYQSSLDDGRSLKPQRSSLTGQLDFFLISTKKPTGQRGFKEAEAEEWKSSQTEIEVSHVNFHVMGFIMS